MENLNSFIHYPILQALSFWFLAFLFLYLLRPKTKKEAWNISLFFILIFLLINAVLSFWSDSTWKYVLYSAFIGGGFTFSVGYLAEFIIKRKNLKGSGESAVFLMLFMFHLPFLLIIALLKTIF